MNKYFTEGASSLVLMCNEDYIEPNNKDIIKKVNKETKKQLIALYSSINKSFNKYEQEYKRNKSK